MSKTARIALALSVSALPVAASAQALASVAEVERALSASSGGDWRLTRKSRTRARVVAPAVCSSGQSWRFAPARRLVVRKCVGGQWQTASFVYRLRQISEIDVGISLRGGADRPFANERRLLIVQGGERMIIRDLPDAKGAYQEDMEFGRARP